jgi:hypothetical protein
MSALQAAAQHARTPRRNLSPPDAIRIHPALTDPTPMRRTSRKKPLI